MQATVFSSGGTLSGRNAAIINLKTAVHHRGPFDKAPLSEVEGLRAGTENAENK
jgi:hypothetical protein